jgi:hypothetical protein
MLPLPWHTGSGILTGFPFGRRDTVQMAETNWDAPFFRVSPSPQDRLTRAQVLLARNPSPLRSSRFSLEYLLLPPRSAPGAVPPTVSGKIFHNPRAFLLVSRSIFG